MILGKQKGSLVFLIVLILVYIFIFYFQKSKPAAPAVEIYFADRVTAAHKILINEYNKKMKGKVKVVPIDFPNFDFSTNERKEVLARSLRGTGDGIDLFAVDVIWVQRFAKWCEPLDKYFSQKEKDRLLPGPMESCYYKDKLYALPLDMVQGVMYYREDLLKKLPNGDEIIKKIQDGITWEDFIKIKNQIHTENPFYIFPAADYEGFICSFMEMILSLKPDYFQKYGFNLEKPEAEKALQFLVDLIYKYKLTPPVVTHFTEVTSYQYFIKHDGLFIRGWPSYDKDFKESPVDSSKEKYLKKANLPYFKNGKPASVLGGWNVMVSKFSTKKKEVMDFIKFLISDKSQEIFYRVSNYYPILKDIVYDSTYLKKYPSISEIRKLLKTNVHRPFHPDYTRFSSIMSNYFELAMKRQISVKEALEKATGAILHEKRDVKDF